MNIKRTLLLIITSVTCFFIFPQESKKISTFEEILKVGLENNYDIKNQKNAVLEAKGKFLQAKGSFDVNIGAQTGFSNTHNPYDEEDLDVKTEDEALYNDIESKTLSGKLFLEKLFAFGINTKLSYELKKSKSVYKNGIYESIEAYGYPGYNTKGKVQF